MYEELGLFDELSKPKNYTIKNLSETFAKTGRLDIEHYDEKYDRLFEEIGKSESLCLGKLVTIAKSVEPGSDNYEEKGIPFIRVGDFTKFGITNPKIYLSAKRFKDTIRPKKDTILLSKDGTVGIAYKLDRDEDIITSSAILHLSTNNKKIMPEYLTLVLNSFIVRMQAERDAGGSIINHWKKSEIEKVKIPIIDMDKQRHISELVMESKSLREKSKKLLDIAVKSVEVAIEDGEEKALELLAN